MEKLVWDYVYYSGKGFIDRTEIHITFINMRLSDKGKLIHPICNDNKRIFSEIGIDKKVTCKKCLKWLEKRIKKSLSWKINN